LLRGDTTQLRHQVLPPADVIARVQAYVHALKSFLDSAKLISDTSAAFTGATRRITTAVNELVALLYEIEKQGEVDLKNVYGDAARVWLNYSIPHQEF